MNSNAKIKISLIAREIEIEGTEEFIKSQSDKIDRFLALLVHTPMKASVIKPATNEEVKVNDLLKENDDISSFGEYFHKLSKTATDLEKILIAGHFAQTKSTDNTFTTREASSLLLEQAVKLPNASTSLKRNVRSKHLIVISKGKFRVSQEGLDYINKLISGTRE